MGSNAPRFIKYLMRYHAERQPRQYFSVPAWNKNILLCRTWNNDCKLKDNVVRSVKKWNQLPKEAVWSSSLNICKQYTDILNRDDGLIWIRALNKGVESMP